MARMPLDDNVIRIAAFQWLESQVVIHGEVLPRKLLEQGLELQRIRVPLIGPQGIFKPQVLHEIPLSITTAPSGPYDDSFAPDGLLRYKYRGTDPQHRDNVGLRSAMKKRVPLVYFHGIVPGKYLAVWPVFIVGDDPDRLTFTVAVEDAAYIRISPGDQPIQQIPEDIDPGGRRAYITRMIKTRLHQQRFRERVINAYRQQCACCRLRHEELLDAAHIVPDADPEGEPIVPNGIALCKLHHAAFDSFMIGISPDYIIRVKPDILEEADGPMLKHGLQGMEGKRIVVPMRSVLRPDPELLEKRFEMFKKVG
jgi:putative restriction endonuclease